LNGLNKGKELIKWTPRYT